MIAGAVTYDCSNSFLHHSSNWILRPASNYSFGIGKGFMCNGANLAYTKSLFEELNGFNDNDKTQVEMMFFYYKAMRTFPNVHYVKNQNNIITTKPLDEWKSYFQRVMGFQNDLLKVVFRKISGCCCFNGKLMLIIAVGSGIGLIPIEFTIIFFHQIFSRCCFDI
jgi:hypothetical protein